MRTGTIYMICNYINEKVYIGQTIQTANVRFNKHMSDAYRRNSKFYKAVREIGKDQFFVTILEDNIPLDKLGEREVYYIKEYNSIEEGYNKGIGGEKNLCIVIPDDVGAEIIKKYKEGSTLSGIKKEYGYNKWVVSPFLKANGVEVRDWNDIQKVDIDSGELKRLYCDEMLTSTEIAKMYKTSSQTIRKRLVSLGVKMRPAKKKLYLTTLIEKDDLYNLFVVEKKPYRKIAEQLGVSVCAVQNHVKKYGLIR